MVIELTGRLLEEALLEYSLVVLGEVHVFVYTDSVELGKGGLPDVTKDEVWMVVAGLRRN
jgi:hypothetical protein